MTLYDELTWRGMLKDVSDVELAKKHLNEGKISFYCGFDPTGKSLTVGHLVQIIRMILMQKYNHRPVAVIGGGTGLIGDPSGKSSERKLLTLNDSLDNSINIEKQMAKYLKGNTLFVNNYEWLSKIDLITYLRDYGKYFNVAYMLAKDTVSRRIDVGLSYTEFSYMIIQSIDWLHLYKNHDVKIQFGGSDQWGNLTSGLELIRKSIGENDAVALSSPLLLNSDGTKFGKSESNALYLDETLTSPYTIYQYFVNANDADLLNYFKLLTLLSKDEIESIIFEHNKNPELRVGQKRIAKEITTFIHGVEAYNEAVMVTDALFTGEFNGLSKNAFETLRKVIDTYVVDSEINIVDALVNTKLASSNRESREFINSNAVSINGIKVQDTNLCLKTDQMLYNKYIIIKRGKKKYALVVYEK